MIKKIINKLFGVKALTVLQPAFQLKRYIAIGLILMVLYAMFGVATISGAAPMFDYVFNNKSETIEYSTTSEVFYGFFEIIPKLVNDSIELLTEKVDSFIKSPTGFISVSEVKSDSSIESSNYFTNFFSRSDPIALLWFLAIMMLLSTILKNLAFMGSRVVMSIFTGRLTKTIREEVYRRYLSLPLSFFSSNRTGDSQVRIFTDVTVVSDKYIGSIISIIRESITFAIFLTIVIFMNARLLMYTIFLVPIFTISISYLGKKAKKYAKRIQEKSSDLFSSVDEVFSGVKIVKAYQKEEQEIGTFKGNNDKFYGFWLKSRIYSAMNQPLSEINGVLTGAILLILGGSMALDPNENFTVGEFMTFMGMMLSILHPIKVITKGYNEIKKAGVSLDRLYSIYTTDKVIHESEDPKPLDSFKNSILVNNISYGYDKDKPVLNGVSFEIKKGEKVAFVGASGSGKTTFTNLLNRMYDVDSGSITLDGVDIKDIKLKDLRKQFGTVTQESILFNRSIEDNIRYGGDLDLTHQDVVKAAEIACCDQFIDELEDGYKTIINPKGANFSGGQKQRLSIARSIVANPPILIFDEATSALDTVAEQKVQEGIDNATKNRTVVVVAHRLSTILNADKIVVFDKGKVVGMGKSDQLLRECEVYKELYHLQFEVDK